MVGIWTNPKNGNQMVVFVHGDFVGRGEHDQITVNKGTKKSPAIFAVCSADVSVGGAE